MHYIRSSNLKLVSLYLIICVLIAGIAFGQDVRLENIPHYQTNVTPTYDGSGQAMHPDVVYFPDGFNGKYFYMAMTPYKCSDGLIENPSILESDNGFTWSVPTGVSNPIADTPAVGHNDDADLFWNEATSEFYMYYLETANPQYLVLLTSPDGVSWTEEHRTPFQTPFRVSPTLTKKGDTYYLFFVTIGTSGTRSGPVEFLTSTDGINWSGTAQSINVNWPQGFGSWHVNVFDGKDGRYYMLVDDYPVPNGSDLYLAYSSDLVNWTAIQSPIVEDGWVTIDGENRLIDGIYRSAGVVDPASGLVVVWFSYLESTATCQKWDWWTATAKFQLGDFVTTNVLQVPSQYATIQAAINAASPYDTVLVAPGTYNENIDFLGKRIVVRSSDGPGATEIQGVNPGQAVVYFDSEEPRGAELEGFTVSGGENSGIFCSNSSPRIENNIIRDNFSTGGNDGGGLDLNNTRYSVIRGNVFTADTANTYGGAIHTEGCTNDTICYNLIYDCYGYMDIRCLSTSAAIYNNTVLASRYHGISAQNGYDTLEVRNNVIVGSPAYGVYAANSGKAKVAYNATFDCQFGAYGGDGITDLGGSISADPQLTADFRIDTTSPCLDAGDPGVFFLDVDGTRNDMGAFPIHQVSSGIAFTQIQMAIDAASDGDIVMVQPGTYTENVDFSGKRILVASRDGAASTTITAASPSTATVSFVSDEPKGATLAGFTVTGSQSSGINCQNSSPTIVDNYIEKNTSPPGNLGGGITMRYTTGSVIRGNVIRWDTAGTYGAGIHTDYSAGDTIAYNLLYGNYGYMEIRCLSSNTVIYNNTIDVAGSLAHGISNQVSGTINCRNNIVVNAPTYGIYAANSGYALVEYNDAYNNIWGSFGGTGLTVGSGNISLNPLFWGSPVGEPGQYDLRPFSPCVDAGDPDPFFNDTDGSRNDMGWKPWYLAAARLLADVTGDTELPAEYSLHQNYPNPFNPTTTIEFDLPATVEVRLEIFNVLGQRVRTIVDGQLEAGHHVVEWNGRADNQATVATGIYIYRLTAENFTESRKMTLLK